MPGLCAFPPSLCDVSLYLRVGDAVEPVACLGDEVDAPHEVVRRDTGRPALALRLAARLLVDAGKEGSQCGMRLPTRQAQ